MGCGSLVRDCFGNTRGNQRLADGEDGRRYMEIGECNVWLKEDTIHLEMIILA